MMKLCKTNFVSNCNCAIDVCHLLQIFEKALDEPKYSSLYAQLCHRLFRDAPNFEPPESNITVRLQHSRFLFINFCYFCQMSELAVNLYIHTVLLSGTTGRVLDLRSTGRGSNPTRGKAARQTQAIGTGQATMMLYGWEGNRRPGESSGSLPLPYCFISYFTSEHWILCCCLDSISVLIMGLWMSLGQTRSCPVLFNITHLACP